MKHRSVQPELLDTLPQDDPEAIRAREEMPVVNGIMGNHRWIERMVRRYGECDWDITELGAGDGALSLRLLNSALCRAEGLHAVDLASRPDNWPAAAAWTCGDVLAHPLPESRIVIANLFLHHFTNEQLRVIGSRLSPATQLFVAVEPARMWVHSFTGWLLCELAELNRVQRHDLQVSVRAGFRSDELGRALGLTDEWHTSALMHPLGGYRFMAWRLRVQAEADVT